MSKSSLAQKADERIAKIHKLEDEVLALKVKNEGLEAKLALAAGVGRKDALTLGVREDVESGGWCLFTKAPVNSI